MNLSQYWEISKKSVKSWCQSAEVPCKMQCKILHLIVLIIIYDIMSFLLLCVMYYLTPILNDWVFGGCPGHIFTCLPVECLTRCFWAFHKTPVAICLKEVRLSICRDFIYFLKYISFFFFFFINVRRKSVLHSYPWWILWANSWHLF